MNEEPCPESKPVFLPAGGASQVMNRWFQNLNGKIMTVIEAAIPDGPQCKATKDLACQLIWQVYNQMWEDLSSLGE